MAQRFYPLTLKGVGFPMLSEQQTRTTIITDSGSTPTQDSAPNVAYCHNVMPSKQGYDSVGFLSNVPAFAFLPDGLDMVDVKVAFGSARSRVYLGWDTEGNVYSLVNSLLGWQALLDTVPETTSTSFDIESVTIGTVNGISYIFYAGIGAFTYDEAINQLEAVTFTGLAIADVLGVVASSGYLIAYTEQAIAWSSTLDPTDFVPSSVTGSGGGDIAGISGAIVFCTTNTMGIIIYSLANAVAGTYTGNTAFPFKFREIEGSKGGITLSRVAYESNSRTQFVYSKAGLQEITSQSAKPILPEVTDFLAGRRFEDFNEVTKLYELTDLAADETMKKKIKYISSRYLVISYGLPDVGFTHAMVFDTALARLGKLKIDHTDVFEYVGFQTEIAKESIAFLLPTGEVKTVDFTDQATSVGVLILGKLQSSRSRLIGLLGVEVENAPTNFPLTITDQASLDGKNFINVEGTLADSEGQLREYVFRSSAKNHSLVLIGSFNVVTLQIRYRVEGRR